jgi:hypothetical protein
MTKPDLREKARQMRLQGMSVQEIQKTLKVSKSSVSLWVRDIQLSEDQRQFLKDRQYKYQVDNQGAQANKLRSKELRTAYQNQGRSKAREGHMLHQAGCMLYWAEGSKERNSIYFVNSDPHMLLLFMRFLREELNVLPDDITLRIHCHTSVVEGIESIKRYWTNLFVLPMESVRKVHVKQGSAKKSNVHVNGVCGIKVHSTALLHHIYGAIQEYGGFENPAWLF